MTSLAQLRVTPRDQQVLDLLVQGCSNKEIAGQLNISPRTVKQHLRTLFLRAGIRDGRKRVKLAIAMFAKESHQEPFAQHFRQAGRLEPPGTGHVRRLRWRQKLECQARRVCRRVLFCRFGRLGAFTSETAFHHETRSHRQTTIIAKPVLGGSLPGFGFHRASGSPW